MAVASAFGAASEQFLIVVKTPEGPYAFTNCVVFSSQNHLRTSDYIMINGKFPLKVILTEHSGVSPDDIALNGKQREWIGCNLGSSVSVKPCVVDQYIASMSVELDFYDRHQPKKAPPNIDTVRLFEAFQDEFARGATTNSFANNQLLTIQFKQIEKCPLMEGKVMNIEFVEGGAELPTAGVNYGCLAANSIITFEKAYGSALQLRGRTCRKGKSAQVAIISPGFDFKAMGIGGLDKEFSDIFRRAFMSRIFPAELVEALGMKHVRGILLYGPPGNGKTLMAHAIGKMSHGREPKIIHGPEILDRYVGQSEANIRQLFAETETEEKSGINSALHIIIFDEIDAICRQRGSLSGSTGVHDTVVNQLLAKIDQLKNTLVIGITNRKDMIDEALLRPGRLEVQIKIGLPDAKGRLDIFNIHTAKLRDSNKLGNDVDLEELAGATHNFSGAEIEGLVHSATSTAMSRMISAKDRVEIDHNEADKLQVTRADFQFALKHDITAKDRVEIDHNEADKLKVTRADFQFALKHDITAKDRVEIDHNEADKLKVTRADFQFALKHDITANDHVEIDHNEAQVTHADFQFALKNDIKPAFDIEWSKYILLLAAIVLLILIF